MDLRLIKIGKYFKFMWQQFIYILLSFIVFIGNIGKKQAATVKKYDSKETTRTVVFLGEVKKIFFSDAKKIEEFREELGSPDMIIFSGQDSKEQSIYDSHKICDVSTDIVQVIDMGDLKVGVAVFDPDSISGTFATYIKILSTKNLLKKSGAVFLVAYVREIHPRRARFKKLVGTLGFDYVIGCGKAVRPKRNYRNIHFSETRVIYCAGNPSYRSAAAFKVRLLISGKKIIVQQEGYYPIWEVENARGTIKVIRKSVIRRDSSSDRRIYLEIEKILRGMRRWDDMIILGEIFNVLNINMPSRYEYLKHNSINRICSRTFEIEPGNIFFFRPQFRDRNDRRQSEFMRLQLILRAFARRSLFIFSYRKLPSFIPHVVIADTTEAHIKVMSWYREKFVKAKIIGVTGSIGKTSTKDMLHTVLSRQYKSEKNLRNTNVQVKIGLNLQGTSSDCQIYVQEIGGGRPGGASRHSRMILPDVAVITNIGTAHIGNYKSQLELMENKLGIIDGIKEGGILFLNGDDKLLINAEPPCKTVYFAVNNKNCEYYVENIDENGEKIEFDICFRAGKTHAVINVPGMHNVLNAVCAFAVAKHFGMCDEDIIDGLKDFKTSGIRQNIIRAGGITLFLDCYNSSVESVDNSLSVLETLPLPHYGKRVAIIGDITGAGDSQQEIIRRTAKIIDTHHIDKIVCYGSQSYAVKQLIQRAESRTVQIKDQEILKRWILDNIKRGDALLLKGSSKVRLDEVADDVYGFNTADQRYIDEVKRVILYKKGFSYNIFETHASIRRYTGHGKDIKIKRRVAGKKIKKIYMMAMMGNKQVENLDIGENIIHIGSKCFRGCTGLKTAVIGSNVRFVGHEAFAGCTALTQVEIKGDLFFLGKDVFSGCIKLQKIIVYGNLSPNIKRQLSVYAKLIIADKDEDS